ncbi:MAG: leucine-rich repeat domain-containing protein, partial [Ruminococcus sp.]|nr:leucine-rich repeat domain-containing protein [Ruminococcus sp.]
MGHKHNGKITKKFVSVLAASAIVTTQIPGNLLATNANIDSGVSLSVGSLFDSNAINLVSVKNQEKGADIPAITTNPKASTTAASTTSVISTTTTSQAASNTTTAVTTTKAASVPAKSASKGLTSSDSGTIQPNPTLSLSKSVISASEAGKTVPVTIFINDDNFKNEAYYGYSTVYVDFDGRLNLSGVQAGTEDGSAGMSASYSKCTSSSYRKTYGVYVYPSNGSNGKNGAFATINVTVPANAQPGDIYYFNIFKSNNLKSYFSYSNSKIKTDYNSYTFATADNSDDKYLKDTPFDGYILIDPESQASSAETSKTQLVMKDLVYYNVYEDHAEVAYCDFEAENVEIASEINGKKVTGIAEYAFAYTNVKSVIVPDTVKTIGYYAFGNSALESIELPDSLETIDSYAFYSTKLKKVNYPAASVSCGSYLFYNCTELKEVVFPDSITSIPSYAFSNCSALENVTLPDSVEKISDYAFSGAGLKSITYPESLKSIGNYAFQGTKIEKAEYPDFSISVGTGLYHNCTALKEIIFPDDLRSIADYTFYGCTSLESVELPDSILSIGLYAFSGSGVKEINIPLSMTTLSKYSLAGTKITSLKIPAQITNIGDGAFYNCSELTSVDLGSKITTLNDKT